MSQFEIDPRDESKDLNINYGEDARELFRKEDFADTHVDDSTLTNNIDKPSNDSSTSAKQNKQTTQKKLDVTSVPEKQKKLELTPVPEEQKNTILNDIKKQLLKQGKIKNPNEFDPSKITFLKIKPQKTEDERYRKTLKNLNNRDYKEINKNSDAYTKLRNTKIPQDDIDAFTKGFADFGSRVNYKKIAKVIPWFAEYSKQPIEITDEKIKKYLKNFFSLDDLIEMRTKQILSGKVKAESKFINFEQLGNYEFLDDLAMSEEQFEVYLDYKIYEMKFYRKFLLYALLELKRYVFVNYQFIALKYFFGLNDDQLKIATGVSDIDKIDRNVIHYLRIRLEEDVKKECQI